MKKIKTKKDPFTSWHACHECNVLLGGIFQLDGAEGITVSSGICPYCNKENTLIPHDDYDFPKLNRKHVWD